MSGLTLVEAPEYAQACDLVDEYFLAVRAYNRALGAFDMTAAELADARRREAHDYARVARLRDRLRGMGVFV